MPPVTSLFPASTFTSPLPAAPPPGSSFRASATELEKARLTAAELPPLLLGELETGTRRRQFDATLEEKLGVRTIQLVGRKPEARKKRPPAKAKPAKAKPAKAKDKVAAKVAAKVAKKAAPEHLSGRTLRALHRHHAAYLASLLPPPPASAASSPPPLRPLLPSLSLSLLGALLEHKGGRYVVSGHLEGEVRGVRQKTGNVRGGKEVRVNVRKGDDVAVVVEGGWLVEWKWGSEF
ncbi:hypothetical protein TeGR_g14422 [Tetraparma gracilis]|uniref:Uncharacterized protein n=1 Tax=Tetraparma gracilis TaxID=2962635 RepID=A0ABQ6M4M5_9STRA|nr:hypothetical protein TeGR_g14422 [Tetraparma gracilis]